METMVDADHVKLIACAIPPLIKAGKEASRSNHNGVIITPIKGWGSYLDKERIYQQSVLALYEWTDIGYYKLTCKMDSYKIKEELKAEILSNGSTADASLWC